jgi:holo-[acyl-carrier protein] synthase
LITGIGVDITSVKRIEEVLEKFKHRFTSRVFTSREQAYCSGKNAPAVHYAGRFAAKEAVKKAAGLTHGWVEIEILNDESGKPAVKLKNPPPKAIINISISHSNEFAVAFVTVEEA